MTTEPFVIAILSGKGGVGKTTISLNLAKQLSHRGPVWLIDIDLFNRGATSALWASERGLLLSVAQLIIDLEKQGSSDVEELTARFERILLDAHEQLAYDPHFTLLPAARAREGRQASYYLWRGMREIGVYAETFLSALVNACNRVTPGCIVVLDGHGGLDELSVAAALVSDLCYIVNEPDLITFTGSVTLFREISEQTQSSENDAWVEFIINRVSPRHDVSAIERDFGPMLDAMSPAREPVAMYFPLEPELFGVFGDDPFVSELYTRYWFSRKVVMLADRVAAFGIGAGKVSKDIWQRPAGAPKPKESTRTALRREFYLRGDALLIAWLSTIAGVLVLAVWTLLATAATLPYGPPMALSILTILFNFFLAGVTTRWGLVQIEHLRRVRRLRTKPGRRLRFGDSEAAARRDAFETAQKSQTTKKPLQTLAIVGVIIVVIALIAVPKFLETLTGSKQRRTMADMLTIATALEARATDVNSYFVDNGSHQASQLTNVLSPTYVRTTPVKDAWGTPFRYYSNYVGKDVANEYAFVSAGRDRAFEHPDLVGYSIDDANGRQSLPRRTKDPDADLVFANGAWVQQPDIEQQ